MFSFPRVYDPESRKIVQKNLGHNDSVRCIIHIPERSQVLLWNYSFVYLFVIFCLDLRGEIKLDEQNISTQQKE